MSRRFTAFLVVFLVSSFAVLGQKKDAGFGTKNPELFSFKGTIYELPADTEQMPEDVSKLKSLGVVYTDKLDVPLRDFTEGFPGVSNRFEWFGIVYTGAFEIAKPGVYRWKLASDDGSRLWIDDKDVINLDGVHGQSSDERDTELAAGMHRIKVWYFQGPATELAIQLFVKEPDAEEEKIFRISDYASKLALAAQSLSAKTTAEGIRINLDATILFDSGKDELKPQAAETITKIAEMIRSYPGATVRVEGHTDSVGEDASNQKLSERRAASVVAALKPKGPSDVKLLATGFGESQPVATNDTDAGRAKNRRVEVLIVP